jgi:hypothetical protein
LSNFKVFSKIRFETVLILPSLMSDEDISSPVAGKPCFVAQIRNVTVMTLPLAHRGGMGTVEAK